VPRIGLTSPYGHPFVRRGIERYCSELAAWLTGRGHDVTWVCTSPTPLASSRTPAGYRMRYAARGRQWGAGRFRIDEQLSCFAPLTRAVHAERFDVVECHHHVDGAATRLGGWRSMPYIQWIPGAPSRDWMTGQPLHRAALRLATAGARRIHCISSYARGGLKEHLGLEAEVVSPGVDTSRYAAAGPTAPTAKILCTADGSDPRKDLGTLIRAFEILCRHRDDVELVLAAQDPRPAEALVAPLADEARRLTHIPRELTLEELDLLYGEATVTVLPSRREAFGLVLVESLAAGTPVVGTDDGAIPEIITNDNIGRLFPAGDADALARTIDEVIAIGRQAGTAEACRHHAQQWDWTIRGPIIERALLSLVGDR
jgi:phosphatidylinositol alpha-mannosyltransferase